MTNQSRMENIQHMEETSSEVSSFLDQGDHMLRQAQKIKSDYDAPLSYYQSEDWMRDHERSNSDSFPSPEDFPHGVL